MKLTDFPPYIIRRILFGTHRSYLVVNLWNCGDQRLNLKLQISIEFMDLKAPATSHKSRFPSMLCWLPKLRYLSVDHGNQLLMPTAKDLRHELSRISASNLETLHLCCNRDQLGLTLDSSSESSLSIPMYTDSSSELVEPRFFDLKTRFSSLQTLELNHAISTAFYSHLPDSLTQLISGNVHWTSESKGLLASLPRSLQVWKADLIFDDQFARENPEEVLLPAMPLIWADPPPALRYISSWKVPGHVEFDDFSFLPRTLEHCTLCIMPFKRNFPPSCITTLPPQLDTVTLSVKSFQMVDLPLTLMPLLPSSLTTLELHLSFAMDYAFFASLPRTLKRLSSSGGLLPAARIDLGLFQKMELSGPAFWPPELTELQFQLETFPRIDLLPSTLTALTLQWFDQHIAASTTWPPLLVSLELRFSVLISTTTLRIEKCKWPSTLKHLEMKGDIILDGFSLLNLPQSLETLGLWTNVSAILLSGKALGPFKLPAGLKKFQATEWSSPLFTTLPRSLTYLEIHRLKVTPKPAAKPLKSSTTKGPLRGKSTTSPSSPAASNASDTSPNVVEEDEKHWDLLPPALLHLEIPRFAPVLAAPQTVASLTGRFFSRLNRLRYLNMILIVMEASALRHFPSTLRGVDISIQNLTSELAPFLSPLWFDSEIIIQAQRLPLPSSLRQTSNQVSSSSSTYSPSQDELTIWSLSDIDAENNGHRVIAEHWHR